MVTLNLADDLYDIVRKLPTTVLPRKNGSRKTLIKALKNGTISLMIFFIRILITQRHLTVCGLT